MFVWSDRELNAEQSRAVIDDNSILLIACPGSGKTRTLTYKIAFELEKIDSKKKYVIAITYTNRAADEIKERVEILGVDTSQLWIGTIHSFCLEWILRPYSLYLPKLKNGFKIINSFDSETIITNLCIEYNKKNSLKGKEAITYWDCNFYASKKPDFIICNKNKFNEIRAILSKYFKILEKNKQIDYEQILYYSLLLLKKKSVICKILSNIFPIILIDEFQDTKEIQYHIICSIVQRNVEEIKLFVVGDPNQSIYQTLGGYAVELEDLQNLSGVEIKQLNLVENYRSSERIIYYFDYFKTFVSQTVAAGKNKGYKSIISLNNTLKHENLIDEIAKIIRHNVKDLGILQNEICIVAPQWVHLASVTRKLIITLPEYSFDGPGMAPFSRDIENFWFKLARILLTEPSPNMFVRRLRWSSEIINELDIAGCYTSEINAKKLLGLCNSISINESEGIVYLEKFFEEITNSLGISISDFPTLEEHYNSFFESSKNRIDKLRKDGIEYISHIETFKKVFQQRKGITVTTFHGTKGAEFDTVIAFALLQDYIPHFSDNNGFENSKKLLYVIASRAKKNLYLLAERERYKNYGSPPPEYIMTKHLRDHQYNYD